MKRLTVAWFCFALVFDLLREGHAQGTIVFNNVGNSDASLGATSNGLVSINYAGTTGVNSWGLLNQDVNFELFAGPNGAQLQMIHTWLLSDNSAKGISVGSGEFADPSHGVYTIPGVQPGARTLIEIEAWAGNYDQLIDAGAQGLPIGRVIFSNPTGGNGVAPASLVGMPALNMVFIPEPSTFALTVMGAGVLVLLGRRPPPKTRKRKGKGSVNEIVRCD